MTKDRLDKITDQIIYNIMRNPEVIYNTEGTAEDIVLDLVDVIASLHNLLYEEVTGKRYNYMFHWTNKVGYNNVRDNIFDEEDKQTNTAEWKIVGKTTLHYECSKCGGAGDKWDKYCKHCRRKMTNAVAE